MVNVKPVLLIAAMAGIAWYALPDDQAVVPSSLSNTPLKRLRKSEPELVARSFAPVKVTTTETAPWANPQVMGELRSALSNEQPAAWRTAIAQALPVLATDKDVQLEVGSMLIGKGDPIDGLAWEFLACMHCTQVDERIGYGCAVKGLCDPNLELIDIRKRDFGEPMVADALARMEEIKAAIAAKDSLAPFTEVIDAQFPRQMGECQQLRTPTPECPEEEIVRQTKAM